MSYRAIYLSRRSQRFPYLHMFYFRLFSPWLISPTRFHVCITKIYLSHKHNYRLNIHCSVVKFRSFLRQIFRLVSLACAASTKKFHKASTLFSLIYGNLFSNAMGSLKLRPIPFRSAAYMAERASWRIRF